MGNHFTKKDSFISEEKNQIINVENFKEAFDKQKQNELLFHRIIEDISTVVGDDFFPSVVKSLSKAFGVRFVFISETFDHNPDRLRLLAICEKDKLLDCFEYDVANTPCAEVFQKGLVYYPKDIQKLFPKDKWLQKCNLDSYMAISFCDTQGKSIGHLGIAHDKPLFDNLPIESILKFLSVRAGAELERMRSGKELQNEVTERKQAEEALKSSESMLKKKKVELEQKNIALKEIIAQVEIEKNNIKNNVITNVDEFILPILRKFKIKGASQKYITYFQNQLEELTSSFGSRITERRLKLAPREIEICNMIRGGLTSKEIAKILNISYQTVEKHRKNIRRKLNLSNKSINLTAFLQKN